MTYKYNLVTNIYKKIRKYRNKIMMRDQLIGDLPKADFIPTCIFVGFLALCRTGSFCLD